MDWRSTLTMANTPTTPEGIMSTKTETKGRVVRWSIGGSDDWATLTVDLGPLEGTAVMSSREAREFAIAVLTDQGPYLGYQPPNESMRERRDGPIFDRSRGGGEPRWKDRQRVRYCAEALAKIREQFGDDAFGYAVQRVVD